MTDYIKREDAQDIIARKLSDYITNEERWILEYVDGEIGDIPSADVIERDKVQREIDYWHDKAQRYEQTILKLALNKADVVEVVRCKDCKYRSKIWYEDKRKKEGGYWIIGCNNDNIAERVYGLAHDDDFCSYGERADA